jgi:hypothetical protein
MHTTRAGVSVGQGVRRIGWFVACACAFIVPNQSTFAAEATNAASATNVVAASAEASHAPLEEAPDYRNWVQLGLGGAFVSDDKAAFQRRHSLPRGAFGGIEDFHYEEDVGKKGLISFDGRGIIGPHDYDIRMSLSDPDKGYVRGGYREFRTYYDGSGGFLPDGRQWFSLYNEDFKLDRGGGVVRRRTDAARLAGVSREVFASVPRWEKGFHLVG